MKTRSRIRQWHERPLILALGELSRLRDELRAKNLHDTYGAGGERPRRRAGETLRFRSYDGSGYDPDDVDMGRAGTRLDRNVPVHLTWPEPTERMLDPNPREVSRRLLTRESFTPATTLNLLAAAWVQFQNHDWFTHGDNDAEHPLEIPLPKDDDWPEDPMCVRRTRPDPVAHTTPDAPPTYENTVTHWWDGSQLYGSSEERCRKLRTGEGGRMRLDADGRLPGDPEERFHGIDLVGFGDNYWVGLSLLHHLFVKEHNAICAMLARAYPSWRDERLFQTARLVNSAVMAKIHTVEWTPAILGTKVLRLAMNLNWGGLLGDAYRRRHGRLGRGEKLSGILGSHLDHHGVPYSMTEEFVTCYRLHPLIPDALDIRSARRGERVGTRDFLSLQGASTRSAVDEYGLSSLLYSFGVAHPGAIQLHNHPNALRDFTRMTGEHLDLGTVDILRDRERGVPRYNDLREIFHKPRVSRFEDLTANAEWAKEIEDVYDGDIDRVDTMVGMYAEPPPPGFGFSETAFRIFVLMASRRLKSDPFFTDLYTPEIYSPEGLAWIDDTGMLDVLHRHHPELAPALGGLRNPFGPWRRLS